MGNYFLYACVFYILFWTAPVIIIVFQESPINVIYKLIFSYLIFFISYYTVYIIYVLVLVLLHFCGIFLEEFLRYDFFGILLVSSIITYCICNKIFKIIAMKKVLNERNK